MKNRKKLFTSMAVVFALLMALAVGAWAAGNANKADLNLVLAPETQLDVYVDGTWSGELSDTYAYGDTATITAPEKSGSKSFSHWTADGSIVSYANPLKLTMNAHTTLYAVYSDSVTATPVAGFTSITRTNDGKSISFQAIASGTSAGIVYSTTATGDNLIIDGTGVTKVEAAQLTDSTTTMPDSVLDANNCWMLQITPDNASTVYHARAYVTVGSETTYGDVKDVKLPDLQSGVSLIANPDGVDPQTEQDDLTNALADLANNMLSVTFDANGGEGVMAPQGVLSNTATKLNANTFTREGYTFSGWSTNENGGGTTYKDGDTVTPTEDITLYAQWTRNSSGGGGGGATAYAITPVKADNGSVSVSPTNATSGKTVTVTVKPDEGYKLDKLTVTDQNGKEIATTEKDGKYTFTMPAGKVTVTPVFVKEGSEPTTPPTDPTTPPADNENPFVDVKTGDYFYDAVLWAAKENITSGTTDTTFSPNESCTRGQTVTFLWREAGSPEPTTNVNPFTDVKTGDYFYKAVLWAYENGITQGTSDTEFSPNATVTRGQTVTFLYRLTGEKTNGNNPFTDVKTGDYYYDSVLWAYENDITSGTSDTTFSPNDNCLRGQIVTFLYRCNK